MKKHKLALRYIALALLVIFVPAITYAHQPRLISQNAITVDTPEISKAYYAKLNGTPQIYTLVSANPFQLYINLLVPDTVGQKTDVTAVVAKDGNIIATLGGTSAAWEKYFEPFGYDHYLQGPEFKQKAAAGTYTITVSSTNNDSKYSLAIGEVESFDISESYKAVMVMPELKRNFFQETPATFLLSPFGAGYVLILFVASFVAGLAYRTILKRVAKNKNRTRTKNIGKGDKLVRVGIGIVLFALGIFTSWSPWLFFFSGFAFFEAIFSWCGFYAALGKNTCPL